MVCRRIRGSGMGEKPRQDEALLQGIADASESLIYAADLQGRYMFANRGLENLFGAPPGGLTGKPRDAFLSAEVSEQHRTNDLKVLETGTALTFEETNSEADGIHTYLSVKSPLRDADGRVFGIAGISTDITGSRRPESEAFAARAKLEAAVESMTDAVFISDAGGRFVDFNDAFATFHKFRDKGECAKTLAEYPEFLEVYLASGELASLDQWAVPRALRGETRTNEEYGLRRKDTGERWIGSYSFAPIRDENGEIVGSVVVGRDVTEEKRKSERLENITRLYATLSEVNQTIVRVKDPLELYRSMCDVAVRFGGFEVAWVGLLEAEAGDIKPVAAEGVDLVNWPFGTVNILEGPFRDGMAATAIRSENVVLSTDVASDARMREALVATRGWDFHASAAIPFRLRGRTVGVLVLISKHAGLFEAAAEVHLLEEMGLDVSFALDSMAAEAERAIAEEDARKELVGRRQAEQAHRFVVASNHALIHGEDQESLLLEVCDVAVGIAGYQCAWIGTVDYQDITSLTLLSSTGDYPELVRWIREHGLPADSPGGRAVRSRTPVFIGDLSAPGLPEVAALATSMGLRSVAVLPLNGFQDQVVGVLFVYSDKSDAFDAREQELMAALAEDLSFGLRHLTSERLRTESERELLISGERLDRLTLQVVEAMGRIVELRDPYTQGHEYGVAALSVAIGTEMGLSEDVLQGLRVAGLLHDIGKMAIPSEILVKPGRLTEVEMTLVQSHVRFSYDMLKGIDFPWPVADAVLQHHERADGSGYPNRLSGDAIMLESRVLAVADVLEAMSGHRPYRPAMGLEAALQELVGHSEAYDRDVLAAVEQLSKVGALDYLDHRTTDVVASAQGARIAQGASSGRTMR